MKRVTCFIPSLGGGGAEHQIVILANFLCESGYDVEVVTYNNISDYYIVDNRIKRVKIETTGHALYKELSIIKFFLFHKTDVVISYRVVSNFSVLIPLLFRPKIKVIAGERNTTQIANFMEKINYNFLYYRADYIVPNSFTQSNYLKGLKRMWSKKVLTITNYTDIQKFNISSIPDDLNVLKIGVFARIFPQKNYERFCKTLYVLKKRTNRKFCVYWYGDKKEGEFLKGSLHIRRLIEELELEDVLFVKDAVQYVSDYMSEFHAMCLPSLYEGFSNSISEYICSGMVVICSDVSDNSLMVKDGYNGFLFDPTNIESMVSSFVKFFSLDKQQILDMGLNSRKIASDLFNKDKFLDSYIQLIES